MNGSPPLVSIITATYNRSNVLGLAIASVRRSTFADWELWVIGDACTDDTAEVVASFADPRIHFINLERNFGEQSGPNNEGFRHCRGRYIAYLNHDDLWLPNHLETLVAGLEDSGADLVSAVGLLVHRDRPNSLTGVAPHDRFEPYNFVPASCWLMRRELIAEIGPWRPAAQCYYASSQEWLYRAWRASKHMRMVPKVSAVLIHSGARPGSYARRELHENQEYFERMRDDPRFLEKELSDVSVTYAKSANDVGVLPLLSQAARNIVRRVTLYCGAHPSTVNSIRTHGRRGNFIRHLRRVRGLAEAK